MAGLVVSTDAATPAGVAAQIKSVLPGQLR
jgi:hypothetical protein